MQQDNPGMRRRKGNYLLANGTYKKTLSKLHSLTSFLLGFTAGILALESYVGFIFYLLGTMVVSGLFHLILVAAPPTPSSTHDKNNTSSTGGAGVYFPGSSGEIDGIDDRGIIHGRRQVVKRKGAWRDVWFGGGVFGEALSGFVLGWAGVGGVLN